MIRSIEHDFLDSVRDPETWAKTKKAAAGAGGFTVELLRDLAKGFVKKQIEEKLTGTVSLVEPSLDASSRQVRLWVDVDNKYGWLIPGGTATIVIPPKK